MPTVRFSVKGLPPKKDGANSMWRKGAEVPRLMALRKAAYEAFSGLTPIASGDLRLKLILFADPPAGDLDNFITGICDGLMACHPQVPIDEATWVELPEGARPGQAIAYADDGLVASIDARRIAPDQVAGHLAGVLRDAAPAGQPVGLRKSRGLRVLRIRPRAGVRLGSAPPPKTPQHPSLS